MVSWENLSSVIIYFILLGEAVFLLKRLIQKYREETDKNLHMVFIVLWKRNEFL